MAAQYWVWFQTANGTELVDVLSADSRTMKAKDIRAASVKARKKAELKFAKTGRTGRAIRVQCVG